MTALEVGLDSQMSESKINNYTKIYFFFQYSKKRLKIKLLTCGFVLLAAHLWTSQSVHKKNTVHLCGVS